MADNTTELEVLNQIVEVLGGQSGQYETVVPVLQQIYTLLEAGITDPEAIAEAVTAWLDEHPEATTTVQDGSITGVKIADDTIPDAKLAQTGGVLERVSDLQDTLFDTARVNLALSAFTAGYFVTKSGTTAQDPGSQLQYASAQITADLVGVEMYVSGTAWYDTTPYVFVGTSVVYPDTSTGSTLTQITDLSFTPTEVGTLYINKFDYGSTHHVGAAKYDEITSIKPSILPQPLPVKDTIDYDAVELTYTTSKLLNGETGLITDGSSENYVVTDYTAVLPDTKVMISAQHFYGQGLYAFYDENRQFISGRSSEAGGTVTKMYCEIVDVPTNAAYIVLGHLRQSSFFYCYLGQGAKQDALPSQMWSRYKWTCVGDSLTEYNIRTSVHYFDYVSAATGINIVNMGVSGSGYAKGDSYNFMTRIADVPTDSDVVTIFGSGNDGSAGLPLGTASDTGTETLGGVINTTIDNLYAIMPVVNLGIVTPTPWQGNMPYNNGFMENYSNLIVEICKRRGIPCLDLFHCSNLNPNSAEVRALAYSKDNGGGTHPDELGHKLIAPRFKAFLETLLI